MSLSGKLRFYRAVLTQDMAGLAKIHWEQFRLMIDSLQPVCGEVKAKTILDIGCGRLYPYTLLLHSLGNQVVGIDVAYIGANAFPLKKYLRSLKRNGVEGFARDFLYAILSKNKTYYSALRKSAGFPVNNTGIDIREMNAEDLLFPDETFDIAVSVATFEHISNVRQAVSELSRVMKKGRVAYILIHLFTSLSGGHHFDYANPSKVPPWDHLRQNQYPCPVYLNKLREHEYLHLLREKFNILRVMDIGVGEGKDFLTPEIRAELRAYSNEELLKRGITIIARRE